MDNPTAATVPSPAESETWYRVRFDGIGGGVLFEDVVCGKVVAVPGVGDVLLVTLPAERERVQQAIAGHEIGHIEWERVDRPHLRVVEQALYDQVCRARDDATERVAAMGTMLQAAERMLGAYSRTVKAQAVELALLRVQVEHDRAMP